MILAKWINDPGDLAVFRSIDLGDSHSTPATRCWNLTPSRPHPLNEGRGLNPGDTRRVATIRYRSPSAQRRPGPQPRRHPGNDLRYGTLLLRSTKAGASTPATPICRSPASATRLALNEGRGLNPGDTAPSGHRCSQTTSLNEGRGLNPGDTRRSPACRSRTAPLNEGRGLNPGDTVSAMQAVSCPVTSAQRRPGPQPRRHLSWDLVFGEHRPRSTKAGASTPATLLIVPESRHERG